MDKLDLTVIYHVIHSDKNTGEILEEFSSPNLVVKLGREHVIRNLFNLSGTQFLYMGAGSSSTAATVDDTRLEYELIGNANRITATNTSGGALSGSDIQTGTYSVSGNTFYKLLPVQVEYDGATDGNQDEFFIEYALFSSNTLPVTPTSTSGVMFNRYVAPTGITLTASTVLTVIANIYV